MARCRDCKLYDLDATRSKSGAILSNRCARCLWESKEAWPLSTTRSLNRRPYAGFMKPNEGERCPCFQKRETR